MAAAFGELNPPDLELRHARPSSRLRKALAWSAPGARFGGYLDRYVGSEYSMAFLPKVEICVWVSDQKASDAAERMTRAARTGRIGDGKVFVMPIDDGDFRLALSHFASGVTVVTTAHEGRQYGMTVASFASLPPAKVVLSVSGGRPGTRSATVASGPDSPAPIVSRSGRRNP